MRNKEKLKALSCTSHLERVAWLEDFRARHLAYLGNVEGPISAREYYFLVANGFSRSKLPGAFFSSMYQVAYLTVSDQLVAATFLSTATVLCNGRYLVFEIEKPRRITKAPSILDVLHKKVDAKYWLSDEDAASMIATTIRNRGPEYLKKVLKPGPNMADYRTDTGFRVRKNGLCPCLKVASEMSQIYVIYRGQPQTGKEEEIA